VTPDNPPVAAPDAFLGLDIGGTKLAAGIARADGKVLAEARAPSRALEGPDSMIRRLVALGRDAVWDARLGTTDIAAIGIGCGGPLDPERGVVLDALNNPGWVDVPIVAMVEEALGRPTFLENDANAGALAEHRYGAGRGVDDMVYLTISTGIGAGVISGGRLLHGANGNAGELGHVSVDHRGRRCRCGGIGCLEAYASGTNIAERAGMPSAEDVVAAVRRGERHATAVWSETVELLGAAIASIVNAFNPRRVVLGGGVTRAGDVLFEPVRRIALQRAMPQLAAVVDILPAALGERTGILGAVAVAVDRRA